MITFLSFADKKYSLTLERIKNEAISSSFFDEVKTYNENDLPEDLKNFCNSNRRGFGYWVWKPYFVYKTIKEIGENDILVYCDAGCTINQKGKNRFDEYIEMVKNDPYANISFQMDHLEKRFSKGDIFKYFDAYNQLDTGQIANCTIILRKNEHTMNLVKLWYETCINERHLITDIPSQSPNDPIFFDNRHDQSIFSVIRKKYGTIFLEDETYKLNNDGSFDIKYPIHCSRVKF
jgi:hypothetical protein